MSKIYAQIDPSGLVLGLSQLYGEVQVPHMIELQAPDASVIGKRWDGVAFIDVPPDPKVLAAAELQAIDAATGMSRTMREAFIALGVKVGADVAYLQQQETKAAAARLKLK